MNPTGALLLPKLRSQFAEFLNEPSLERLWILSSSTCVGLRYGSRGFSLEVFLGSVASTSSHHTVLLCASAIASRRINQPETPNTQRQPKPKDRTRSQLRHPI